MYAIRSYYGGGDAQADIPHLVDEVDRAEHLQGVASEDHVAARGT